MARIGTGYTLDIGPAKACERSPETSGVRAQFRRKWGGWSFHDRHHKRMYHQANTAVGRSEMLSGLAVNRLLTRQNPRQPGRPGKTHRSRVNPAGVRRGQIRYSATLSCPRPRVRDRCSGVGVNPARIRPRARCAADPRRHSGSAPCAIGPHAHPPCGCRHRCRAPRPGQAIARVTTPGPVFP